MKTLSLVLTFILMLISIWFLNEFIQVCAECNPIKAITDELENTDIIVAIVNFVFAAFSIYLIVKKKFITSSIISGIVAGSQLVMVVMLFINRPL